ncbi:MAG: hypothetical protein V1867_03635 [Candidatus Falkowbacteria bacterium]
MTAKKAIKITVEDNEKNENDISGKAEDKKIKPKKPRAKAKPKADVVRKSAKSVTEKALKKPVKKTRKKIAVRTVKIGAAAKKTAEKTASSDHDEVAAAINAELANQPGTIKTPGISGTVFSDITPLAKSFRDRINVVNEDKHEEFSLKGANAVRSVIDTSQKEKEEKETEEIIDKKYNGSRSIKLYRKIALSFVVLTLILLAAIFYFSFVRVTITLIPNQERISNNMIFDVYDGEKHEEPDRNAVGGLVKKVLIKNSGEYEASGTEVIGKEAVGKVKIINNYNKNQPLVASTRLLTADGKLFRLAGTVNIPAGGSVDAEVYADEPSPEMAIPPTKFTIPGLWAGLQDKIYAESSEDVVYRQKVKKHIVQEDIDNGIRDLKQELLAGAKEEINEQYKDYDQIIYKIDENSIKSEVQGKVGEEKDNFSVTMEADVIVVAFNDQTAVELAKQKFASALAENKELLSFDDKNIIYALNNYDHVEGLATINAAFEGKVTLKENSNIVDVNKLLGLNKDQLNVYLENIPEIAGFEVKFYPSFISKVPRLVDRINIEVKK